MKIKVYVDDLRKCPEGWVLARTNTEAIRFLHNQEVEEISIDHDICFYSRPLKVIQEVKETFKPIVYYLAVMPEHKRPQKIYFHSANPVGAHEMRRILEEVGIQSETKLSQMIHIDQVWSGEYGN